MSLDTLAITSELALIIRGEHPAWEGDRRANAYRFAVLIADDFDVDAVASLARDIERNLSDLSTETGLTPTLLYRFARVLTGSRDGGPL